MSIAALLAGSFIDYARADVGYVCDGNVVVMVAPGDLERMKRENACVASHHMHDVAGKAADTVSTASATSSAAHAAASPAPVGAATIQPAMPAAHVGLRGVQPREEAPSRLMMFASGNVRILNAAPRASD